MRKKAAATYDEMAWFYEKYWGDFHTGIFPAIEELLLKRIKPGSTVLDLCCGTGHLSRLLAASGLRVFGSDLSTGMLELASSAVPEAAFFAADARALAVKASFDAVVSTFDSMNHVLEMDELVSVFKGVREALRVGGVFLFDILLEEAYLEDWNDSGFYLGHDNACLLKGGYDRKRRLAHADITMFRLLDCWTRSDVTVFEKYYPPVELMEALSMCGFSNIRYYDAKKDLRLSGRFSRGRAFISAKRSIP